MTTMYKIKPILKTPENINLPTCMYRLPNLYEDPKSQPMPTSNTVPDDKALHQQMLNIVSRQQQLIAALTKLETELDVPPSTPTGDACSKFTVTNLSSDERALRQLIDRQERLIKNLTTLEQDIHRLVGDPVTNGPAQPKSQAVSAVNQHSQPRSAPSGPGDFCIQAPIGQPPQKVRQLIDSVAAKKRVFLQTLYHCSTTGQKRPAKGWTDSIDDQNALSRADYDLTFTVVFKKDLPEPVLMVNPLEPSSHVRGEAAIVKQLSGKIGA